MRGFLKLVSLHLFGAALVGLLGFSTTANAQNAEKKESNVDLVICLDTSGSMNGLIDSAKVKLWDIVNELAKAEPAPNLRIALFTYGSPQYGPDSGYVKKNLDFTTDLDMVYQKLFAVRTGGGTELVARVSKAALDDLAWSKDKSALRMIFVCGNESAEQDQKFSLESVAKAAVNRNIFINTIHCKRTGTSNAEAKGWQKLAALAEGRFASIDQNKGTVVVNSPVDKKLAELGVKLNKTYVWYGKAGEAKQANQLAQDQNAAKLGGGVEAARALSKTNNFYRMAGACLVDRLLENPDFDITKVKEKDLPEHLKKLKPAERVKYVNDMKAKRVKLQEQINELSKQRDAYVREYLKKNQGKAEQAFDEAIRATLQIQGKQKGISIQK